MDTNVAAMKAGPLGTSLQRKESVSIRHGSTRLEIRQAVAWREKPLCDGVGFYLSLYDDEIDARAASFWKTLESHSPEEAVAFLELTDAVFCFSTTDNIWLARGGAATFPLYWRKNSASLCFTTCLPIDQGPAFSKSGLVQAAAAACLHSSYEPNGFVATPLAEWWRVRRAAFMRFHDGSPASERLIMALNDGASTVSRSSVSIQLQEGFKQYGEAQKHVRTSLLEVSGGFDSTLAAAAAPRHEMYGASAVFPYYEFRFETGVQKTVAEALMIPRIEFDGVELFPYAPSDTLPRFDEPSVFVTGIRHAEVMARYAADLGAERIYMGHGGDQCFATDLTTRESFVSNPPSCEPFTDSAWLAVKRAMESIRHSPFTDRRTATFVYDARQDVWVKETFGPVIRTPFTDTKIFRCAQAWSRYCAAKGVRPNKSILADALPGLLPTAVINRKGKVAYDGVWMRAYRRQEGHICSVFERSAPILEYIGISPRWLIARASALANWRECSDREVLAVYAVAVWLQAWSINHTTDVTWSP